MSCEPRRCRTGLEAAGVHTWEWTPATGRVWVNDFLAYSLGYQDNILPDWAMGWRLHVHPVDWRRARRAILAAMEGHAARFEVDIRIRSAGGEFLWYSCRGGAISNACDKNTKICGILLDISRQKFVEEELLHERGLFDDGPTVVFRWRALPGWPVDYASNNVERVFGYAPGELITGIPRFADLIHPEDLPRISDEVAQLSYDGITHFEQRYRLRTKQGDYRWVYDHTTIIRDGHQDITHYLGYVLDITEHKITEERIRHLATHDALTNLQNLNSLKESLEELIARCAHTNECFATLTVDVDRFRRINDSLGNKAGDELIKAVADRIRSIVHPTDIVGRVTADEFVILLQGIPSSTEAAKVAARIRRVVGQPFFLPNGQEIRTTVSVGICMFPSDAKTGDDLLRFSKTAMRRAQADGQDNQYFFSADLQKTQEERLRIENELELALVKSEFRLLYQPQIDAISGAMVGVEALIRWEHPIRGMIGPGDFLPIAEETPMILDIGEWVLDEACRQLSEWDNSLSIAVNLSAKQFQDIFLAEKIAETLAKHNVPAKRLKIELTESSAMNPDQEPLTTLRRIRDLGVDIAIDDFGTGFSSLSYLRQLPVTTVKIDRSFIHDLHMCRDGETIVKAIIGLGHGLGLTVIAEGVEHPSQIELLKALGCDIFQGYFFSKPVSPLELAKISFNRPPYVGTGKRTKAGVKPT